MAKLNKLRISSRLLKKKNRKSANVEKHCRFCSNKDNQALLDYKNTNLLKAFITERGKILPSRISGACCKHQREISHMIKKSRTMALLPYAGSHFR